MRIITSHKKASVVAVRCAIIDSVLRQRNIALKR